MRISDVEVERRVKAAIEASGQKNFAKKHKISEAMISFVMSGKKRVSERIAKCVGVERVWDDGR